MKSNLYCSVPMCKSYKRKKPELTFHGFPSVSSTVSILTKNGNREVRNRRDEWIRAFKINRKVSPYMKVCSLHFKEDDFFKGNNKRRALKKNVIPSKNLPKTSSSRAQRTYRRHKVKKNKNATANKQFCEGKGLSSKIKQKVDTKLDESKSQMYSVSHDHNYFSRTNIIIQKEPDEDMFEFLTIESSSNNLNLSKDNFMSETIQNIKSEQPDPDDEIPCDPLDVSNLIKVLSSKIKQEVDTEPDESKIQVDRIAQYHDNKKMNNIYCSVPMCKSDKRKNPELTFHVFPPVSSTVTIPTKNGNREVRNRRDEWIKLLKINRKVSPHMKVCSLHFKDDYFFKGNKIRRPLKKNAVPSKNLPKTSSSRAQRTYRRREKKNENAPVRGAGLSSKIKQKVDTKPDESKIQKDNVVQDRDYLQSTNIIIKKEPDEDMSEFLSIDSSSSHLNLNKNNIMSLTAQNIKFEWPDPDNEVPCDPLDVSNLIKEEPKNQEDFSETENGSFYKINVLTFQED